jgi:hypothetical protein
MVADEIENVIEGGVFLITSQQYLKETGFLDYTHHELPEGFAEITESVFKFDGELSVGRQKLLDAGFVESDKLIDNRNME